MGLRGAKASTKYRAIIGCDAGIGMRKLTITLASGKVFERSVVSNSVYLSVSVNDRPVGGAFEVYLKPGATNCQGKVTIQIVQVVGKQITNIGGSGGVQGSSVSFRCE